MTVVLHALLGLEQLQSCINISDNVRWTLAAPAAAFTAAAAEAAAAAAAVMQGSIKALTLSPGGSS